MAENLLKSALDKARRENAALQDKVSELEDTVRSLKRSVFLLGLRAAPEDISAGIAPPRAAADADPAVALVSAMATSAATSAAAPAAAATSGLSPAAAAAARRGEGDAAEAGFGGGGGGVGGSGSGGARGGGGGARAAPSSSRFAPFIERVDLKAHSAAVYAVRFAQDGALLATAGFDRSVVVWAIDNHVGESSRPRLTIADAHRAPVVALDWPDAAAGCRVLTGGFDASAAEWDVASGAAAPVSRWNTRGLVNAVSVAKGNPHIVFAATSRKAVHMFDRRAPVRSGGTGAAASSQAVLSAAARAAADETTIILDNDSAVNAVHVEYDGLRVLTGDNGGAIKTWDLRMVTTRAAAASPGLYKAKPASLVDSILNDPERRPITDVHSSPAAAGGDHGRCLAVNSYDSYLRVYDRGAAFLLGTKTAALRPLHALRGVSNRNWPIKSSFFVGADYRPPRAVARGKPVVRRSLSRSGASLHGRGSMSGIRGGEDGGGNQGFARAAGGADGANGAGGGRAAESVVGAGADGMPGESAAESSSDDVDSAGDDDMTFDSTSDEDDEEEHVVRRGCSQPRAKGSTYRPCEMPVQSACILASGSADGNIYLFDVGGVAGSGARVQRLRGHRDRVHSVVFHPFEPMLASASADNTVKLWSPGKNAS